MKIIKAAGLTGFVLAIIGLLLFVTFKSTTPSDVSRQPVKVVVMLSWYPGAENAFLYYGLAKGIFKKYGLDVEIQPSKGSSIVASALTGESADFGFISSDYLITSVAGGNDLRALLTLYHETPVTIYSLPASNITKPEDLRGKKLAVLSKSAAFPQVINYLEMKGVGEFVQVPGTGAFTDITEGKADAAMDYTHYAPVTLEVKKAIKPNEIRLSDDFKNFYGTSLATTGKKVERAPEVVQRFTCAMFESLDASLKDEAGAVDALVKASGNTLEADVMTVAVKKVNAMISRDTEKQGLAYMSLDGWAGTVKSIETLSKVSLSNLNVSNAFDASFLQKARDGKCKGI